jgi:hypothetical protein
MRLMFVVHSQLLGAPKAVRLVKISPDSAAIRSDAKHEERAKHTALVQVLWIGRGAPTETEQRLLNVHRQLT